LVLRPASDVVPHHGPPLLAKLLVQRQAPAIAGAAINRRGTRFAPTLVVPAVDDDVDSIANELAVKRPEQRTLIASEDHQHRRPSARGGP